MFRNPSRLTATLMSLLAALIAMSGMGSEAQSPAVAPVLVPYTITALAGNTQSSISGYGGEGVPGLNATLNGPNALAVDSVGNVYIADQANALLREWNAQTGLLRTIAGMAPSKCTGTTCTTTNPGCSDGVPAAGNQVGSRIQGLVVDGFGNVYFADYNYQGVWVIYRGGSRVAAFINVVDGATVQANGGVIPGYIYHVAGTATPKAGGGCTATSGSADKVLATKATFHDPLQMGIDAAGNLYVQEYANNVVRVINTQATTQTFMGVSVQPGYVASIVGCNSTLTQACPSVVPAFGSSAQLAIFNYVAGMTTDQYGNVYEINTKGATASIYAGVAYAGGAGLAHLLNAESGLTATPGGWYEVINNIASSYATGYSGSTSVALEPAIQANGANNIVLRPASIAVDPLGNVYMMDTHWQTIYRVDVNSQMATRLSPGPTNSSQIAPVGTTAAPVYCTGTTGPQTSDAYGDGCSIQNAKFSSAGTGYVTFDAAGNLYVSDTGNNLVRKVSLGTQFAKTAIGASLQQTLQVHFDASNLPSSSSAAAFTVLSGVTDYSVSNVSCANFTLRDNSTECYVTVNFSPTATGLRRALLQATTASGGTYTFPLSGYGTGAQVAVDGGEQSALATSGLGQPTAVATDAAGNLYIADAANNQVVKTNATGATIKTLGSGLSGPRGVAVDAAGDVFISDTGNNRIVEVAALTGTQSVVTTDVKSPQGLAVDRNGNLYIADTGNARIVEVSSWGELGEAPLLAYTGAQTLVSPVGVAVDSLGNVYVADSGNSSALIEITAGGGDLQPTSGGTSLAAPAQELSLTGASISAPAGIAIDAANNLYVSDSSGNVVQAIPGGSGPGSEPFTLSFSGLSKPGGMAMDTSGNLYLADTGNGRVLVMNRSQVAVNFGTVPRFQPAATSALTVTNVGSSPLTPATPFVSFSGASSFGETDGCAAADFPLGTLGAGLHCALTMSFVPAASGSVSATASVQNGGATVNLTGVGQNPLATLALALTSPAGGLTPGSPAVITLTATQPSDNVAPTGTVTFNYTVNGVAQTPVTANLAVAGSQSTAALTIPNVMLARTYVISATYNGDANNTVTNSSALTIVAPGLPLTAVANPATYTYGGTVPAVTGTVTGILPADQAAITVSFTTTATSSSPVGAYPIQLVLTGGNSANYTIPTVVTSSGAKAVVTEAAAPLTVVLPAFSTVYGATDLSYAKAAGTNGQTMAVTGLVNGDKPVYTFTPAHSSVLNVGTYAVVPTLSIPSGTGGYDKINNYAVSITNGSVVVSQAPSQLTVTQPATAVLPTALSSGQLTIVAAQQTYGNYGTPTGTVTVSDTFTPISAAGSGTPVNEPALTLPLVGGTVTYTPTSATLGTHVYTFAYSGDANFAATNTTASPTTLIVDQPDYTVTSTTTPILVAPGIVPGGIAADAGEQAATPETATVYIAPVLGSTATITLTCTTPASYITCSLSPTSVTLAGKTLTSTLSVSTPATLPANYTSSLRTGRGSTWYATIPLALLAFLPAARKRRKGLPQLLLLLIAASVLAGASGCGGNNVKMFTPVPAGPQNVTVIGSDGTNTRSFVVPINIQ